MTDTFNPVEIAEDKDLTIQQLRGSVAERDAHIKQYSTELSNTYTTLGELRAEHDQLQAGFENYQRTAVARYQILEDKYDAVVTASYKPAPSSIDNLVTKYVTELVSSLLEGNDIRALIVQAIDQQVERIITADDFAEEAVKECLSEMKIDCEDHVQEAVDEEIRQYLDSVKIDCEEQVEKAIYESLEHVELKFGRRY